jgi:hypothetical protein
LRLIEVEKGDDMKKLVIVVLSLSLAVGASAQRGHFGGGGFAYRPHVVVGIGGYAPFYPFGFGYGFYPYPYGPYWGYPYGSGYYRPSQLSMQVADIKYQFADKITAVKEDKSLTHKQRRQKIRELKLQRDQAINDARSKYYHY